MLSFRNYESLKLQPNNYFSVGWNFFLASIFYLFVFLFFLSRNDKDKNLDSQKIITEIDNKIDRTEPFIEGRI